MSFDNLSAKGVVFLLTHFFHSIFLLIFFFASLEIPRACWCGAFSMKSLQIPPLRFLFISDLIRLQSSLSISVKKISQTTSGCLKPWTVPNSFSLCLSLYIYIYIYMRMYTVCILTHIHSLYTHF